MFTRIFSFAIVTSIVTATCSAQPSIVHSDGDFHPADWSLVYHERGSGGSAGSVQLPTGGNPDSYHEITIQLNPGTNNSGVFAYLMRGGATHDPADDGAILSIDYREDFRRIGNGATAAGPAVLQDGVYYYGDMAAPSNATWTEFTFTDLDATDFRTVADPFDHPDFSASGGVIQFGYRRANTTLGGGYTTISAIDNWEITIHLDCPGDFNQDGVLNSLDVLAFLNAWTAQDPSADFNGDTMFNTVDLLEFLNAWVAGC